MRANGKRPQAGTAIIEFSLLVPWFLFLFAGVLDFGFYAYALISTENAARAAALYTSSDPGNTADAGTACRYVLDEMRELPNIKSAVAGCNALPLLVTAEAVTGVDGARASRVTVTYQTVQLFPIPGLTGRLTMSRVVEMRVNGV